MIALNYGYTKNKVFSEAKMFTISNKMKKPIITRVTFPLSCVHFVSPSIPADLASFCTGNTGLEPDRLYFESCLLPEWPKTGDSISLKCGFCSGRCKSYNGLHQVLWKLDGCMHNSMYGAWHIENVLLIWAKNKLTKEWHKDGSLWDCAIQHISPQLHMVI